MLAATVTDAGGCCRSRCRISQDSSVAWSPEVSVLPFDGCIKSGVALRLLKGPLPVRGLDSSLSLKRPPDDALAGFLVGPLLNADPVAEKGVSDASCSGELTASGGDGVESDGKILSPTSRPGLIHLIFSIQEQPSSPSAVLLSPSAPGSLAASAGPRGNDLFAASSLET